MKNKRELEIDSFLKLLKELWLIYPEQRFAQLLFNYSKMGTLQDKTIGPLAGVRDFFFLEDKIILEGLKKAKKERLEEIEKIKKINNI